MSCKAYKRRPAYSVEVYIVFCTAVESFIANVLKYLAGLS